MYSTAEFSRGLKIEIDGKPFIIVEFQHVKPGKGGAFVRTKLKNLETGQVLEQTFRSGAKVGKPDLEEMHMQYLYQDGDNYVFMDNQTYDQIFVAADYLGEAINYMKPNIDLSVLYFNSPFSAAHNLSAVSSPVYSRVGTAPQATAPPRSSRSATASG